MKKTLIRIDFADYSDNPRANARIFEKALYAAEKILLREKGPKKVRGCISLALTDDSLIKKINNKYRHIDAPTDVVSLGWIDEKPFVSDVDRFENLIGEIFISVETAEKNAKEDGKDTSDELVFLFVHGLLHIFGYDHLQEAEKKSMFALQDEIMELIS